MRETAASKQQASGLEKATELFEFPIVETKLDSGYPAQIIQEAVLVHLDTDARPVQGGISHSFLLR